MIQQSVWSFAPNDFAAISIAGIYSDMMLHDLICELFKKGTLKRS